MKYFKKNNSKIPTTFVVIFCAFIVLLLFIFKSPLLRSVVTINGGALYVRYLNTKASIIDFFENNKIEVVDLEMSPNNFVRMQSERSKMVSNFILNGSLWKGSNQYYKVKFKRNNLKSDGQIKLFGMNPDHFRDFRGHSFRMKFDGSTGFGRKKVNYINPRSRDFISDIYSNQLFNSLEDGIKINYDLVNIYLNKVDYGYYLKEDFFDKYLLEENNRRESVIFEIINDSIHFNHIGLDNEFLPLSNELTDLLTKDYNSFLNLFDIEKIKAILFISLILNDTHFLGGINLHWYFNPVTGLLEPTVRESFIYEHSDKEIDINNLIFENRILNDLYNLEIKKTFEDYIVENIDKALDVINSNYDYLNYKKKLNGFSGEVLKREKIIKSNIRNIKDKFNSESSKKTYVKRIVEIKNDTLIKENSTFNKNEKLIIHPGIQIILDNVILKIYGGLEILGDQNNRTLIKGKENNPSTIFINSDENISILNTDFRNLTNLKSSYDQPASITFYETSNVLIENCTFSQNTNGDDYINFFRSKNIVFKNSKIINCLNDAIDSDFSDLLISNSVFENIGNDAVDGSGSYVKILNSNFYNVKDKAISAGENSSFEVLNSKFVNNEIALVAKDQSDLIVKDNILAENRLDLVAFKKKKIFDYPEINVINTNVKEYLIEKKSIVNGMSNIIFTSEVESQLYGNIYGRASR